MPIEHNFSLQEFNTFGLDVRAQMFARFKSADDLHQILTHPAHVRLPLLILGGGSNVLFLSDFNGLVLKNEMGGISLLDQDDKYYFVKAGAGENWHQFVMTCIENGWAGLENLSLIPGNVGASPMQNIGAYGVEIKDRFLELEAYNLVTGKVEIFNNAACAFGYRESVFKNIYKGKYIILSVTYRLLKTPDYNTSYGAIAAELESMGVKELSIRAVSEAVINIRNSKLPNPKELPNAGSFFKNPVISLEKWKKISQLHPEIPHYTAPDNHIKLAAGWLIEHAGWKGKRVGNVGMHAQQALVLVNYGGATGSELYDHSTRVKDSVFEKFGVELEREVNVIRSE